MTYTLCWLARTPGHLEVGVADPRQLARDREQLRDDRAVDRQLRRQVDRDPESVLRAPDQVLAAATDHTMLCRERPGAARQLLDQALDLRDHRDRLGGRRAAGVGVGLDHPLVLGHGGALARPGLEVLLEHCSRGNHSAAIFTSQVRQKIAGLVLEASFRSSGCENLDRRLPRETVRFFRRPA